MKHFVLFVGGGGARAAEALLTACCAGVLRADRLQVLLADTDHRGALSAELLQAKYADYSYVQCALQQDKPARDLTPFRTMVDFHSWPQTLPGCATTLQEMTADSQEDQLLCQAIFGSDVAQLDLRDGFHGQRMLGKTVFAGMLEEAAGNAGDALTRLIAKMNEALDADEEVRVVLCGSVTGGTGAAGLPLLARHVHRWTAGRARIGAVLLAASGDHEDPVKAQQAIEEFAGESACSAVCLLGLPLSSCSSAPSDYAHLADWLAVYSMDVLLHRPVWPQGLFTVQTDVGPLSWEIFGKAAGRYRLAYGRLMKAALAWNYVIGPKVESRLRHPFFLRELFSGWYRHFFRHADAARGQSLEDVARMTRLMRVVTIWLAGLMRTLPPEMCHWDVFSDAVGKAKEHYQSVTELAGQLVLLDEAAQQAEAYEEARVYRRQEEDQEAVLTGKRADAVRAQIELLSEEQEKLNGRIGGAAAIRLLQQEQARVEAESAELQARYDEANRRIDHAEKIAAPEDHYRITDARTKLERMVRHQRALDAQMTFVTGDIARALEDGGRYSKPVLIGTECGNGLFHPDLTDRLLRQERSIRARDVKAAYPNLVQPADGRTLKQTLKRLGKARVCAVAPAVSLLRAIILESMEEV